MKQIAGRLVFGNVPHPVYSLWLRCFSESPKAHRFFETLCSDETGQAARIQIRACILNTVGSLVKKKEHTRILVSCNDYKITLV